MVLQYVAASFHLPSIRTANINTVQYTKLHTQYEIPTIPAVVIFKVLLPQSNVLAAFVHSHSSLLSDVCPGLQTYNNPNVTQFAEYSVQPRAADLIALLPKMSNRQHTTIHFNLLLPHCKVVITLFHSKRNYKCQLLA